MPVSLRVLILAITYVFLALGFIPASAAMMTVGAISNSSFNPSLAQTVTLPVTVQSAGTVTATVLDRDGYPIRELPSTTISAPETITVSWDGRDQNGKVVSDEAYSFKVDFSNQESHETYFPANSASTFHSIEATSYDRQSGVLRYTLPVPARVHIQAGSAKVNAAGVADGPVLKTLVNRSPRPAGAVIEHWRGRDESGTVYVPDLPNFVIAIVATSLPENSVIAVGNRSERFIDTLPSRHGASLISHHLHSHAHHHGLETYDDTAPNLSLNIHGAERMKADDGWKVNKRGVRVTVRVDGPSATRFAKQPATLYVFLDNQLVKNLKVPSGRTENVVPVDIPSGKHVLSINWVSDYGPVAANSLRVQRPTS